MTSSDKRNSDIVIFVSLIVGGIIGAAFRERFPTAANGILGLTAMYLVMRSWIEFGKKKELNFHIKFPQDYKIVGLMIISAIIVIFGVDQVYEMAYSSIKSLVGI